MKNFYLGRYTISNCVATAMLAACAGTQPPIGVPQNYAINSTEATHHKTFDYTGTEQKFVVPAAVTRLTVVARGGSGGGSEVGSPSDNFPGLPGRVSAVIRPHAGDKLYVFVGGKGSQSGGFNGGGSGGANGYEDGTGYAGGGASDVRMGGDTLKDRIIVAAGGGGAVTRPDLTAGPPGAMAVA
jgi:hypothetical protein